MIFHKFYCADVVRVYKNESVIVGGATIQVPFWTSAAKAHKMIDSDLRNEYGGGYKQINFRRVK